MYTSFGKANDRFGFRQTGKFRCAYANTRLMLIAGMIIVGAVVVLIIVNLVYIGNFVTGGKTIIDTDRLVQLEQDSARDDDEDHYLVEAFSPDFIGMSATAISTGMSIFLLIILVAAFIVLMILMKNGQQYEFIADENTFTVKYPPKMNKVLTIEYEQVIGVLFDEWSFPFAPKCMDITIRTKQGSFEFRFIHTPLSKANGLTETPFNIIRERIGLAKEDDTYGLR